MKKTLIALLALAGVAAADTGADLVTLLQTKIQETSYTLAGNYTYDLSFTMTGNIPYEGGNGKYTLKLADGYYLVSQSHIYWGLGASEDGVTTNTSSFTFNAENDVYTYTSNSGEKIYTWTRDAENSGSGTRSLGGAITVALGYDGSNTTLTLNYGGSDITDKFVLVGTEIDLENLGINPAPTLSAMSVSITPVATPAVPEPTTATLSLLALAGLAARRRRK